MLRNKTPIAINSQTHQSSFEEGGFSPLVSINGGVVFIVEVEVVVSVVMVVPVVVVVSVVVVEGHLPTVVRF